MYTIVNSALKYKAIIYGKYVKNKIIMEYNRKLNNKLIDIVFDNIDLCFNSVKNLELFVDYMCEKFDMVMCKNIMYECTSIKKYKYRVLHVIPSLNSTPIKLKYDINVCVSSIEPPFGNIDLLTNSIIIKYEHDNYMFSKNTGLYLNDNNKYSHFLKVIKLIRTKKDYVVKYIDSEQSAISLILKIVNDTADDIEILNIDWITFGKYINNPCIICLENSSDICLMKTSYFHHKCFCNYIRTTKIYNDVYDDKIEYYFMSPYREKCTLNFSKILIF